ncbi:MAG: hypothetical protein M5R41_06000 [Bacteroidia bacterium]|nr:hypothetical protein [Bacteroidia bacterium]
MGQQSFIIVALSTLLLSISLLGFMGMWDYSNETTASLFEREQALNVARSGVNMAVSRLRREKNWRMGFTSVGVAGGTTSVRVTDIGIDSVRIQSRGLINGAVHNILVEAKLSSIFPNVESALTVFGDSVSFTNSGTAFDIDGRDWNIDGTMGSSTAVHGIGVQTSKIVGDVTKQVTTNGVEDRIWGAGGQPSIGQFGATDLISLQNFYKARRTILLPAGKYASNSTFGSLAKPEIVHVPGDLEWTGTITGAGILVVDGQLIMKGGVKWQGIILALSGDVRIELGGTGTPSILGTVWVGNTDPSKVTNVHVNGNPSVKYSYQTLSTVLGNLGLLAVEIYKYYE